MKVLIALFIPKPTPFFEDFLRKVKDLKYPKNKINLFIYNSVEYHEEELEKFVKKYKNFYNGVKQIKPEDKVDEVHAKTLAV